MTHFRIPLSSAARHFGKIYSGARPVARVAFEWIDAQDNKVIDLNSFFRGF